MRNKATVTYYLLLDNRRNIYGGYLGAEYDDAEVMAEHNSMRQGAASALGVIRPSQVHAHMMQERLVAEQRWMLGTASKMGAQDVINELMRVLKVMNVAWKKNGPYNMKCMCVFHSRSYGDSEMGDGSMVTDGDAMDADAMTEGTRQGTSQNEPTVLKFELQVYKMGTDRLMVDFQRVDGGVMISLDVAAKVMSLLELR